jgi:hypothetical protein
MIGGIDIQIPTYGGASSIEVAVRTIRQQWPQAVFENGLTGERYDHFRQIPFGDIEEIFVYRDRNAADLWDQEGSIPATQNTMIHLLADADLITAVVDERDPAMEEILAGITMALRDEILCIPAELEAA